MLNGEELQYEYFQISMNETLDKTILRKNQISAMKIGNKNRQIFALACKM